MNYNSSADAVTGIHKLAKRTDYAFICLDGLQHLQNYAVPQQLGAETAQKSFARSNIAPSRTQDTDTRPVR